ncbi:unnamed protein product [Auanema sp. JU1783]|nr:unnamed protein product [Auanema sp. JU1783]
MDNTGLDHKRAVSAFDTLGGIGLGKRSQLSAFDTLGGIGLGKRPAPISHFDTLGGIGLGKRASFEPEIDPDLKKNGYIWIEEDPYNKRSAMPFAHSNGRHSADDKRALSAFDTLGGIGLGRR